MRDEHPSLKRLRPVHCRPVADHSAWPERRDDRHPVMAHGVLGRQRRADDVEVRGDSERGAPAFAWRERPALFCGVAPTSKPAGCAQRPAATDGGLSPLSVRPLATTRPLSSTADNCRVEIGAAWTMPQYCLRWSSSKTLSAWSSDISSPRRAMSLRSMAPLKLRTAATGSSRGAASEPMVSGCRAATRSLSGRPCRTCRSGGR